MTSSTEKWLTKFWTRSEAEAARAALEDAGYETTDVRPGDAHVPSYFWVDAHDGSGAFVIESQAAADERLAARSN